MSEQIDDIDIMDDEKMDAYLAELDAKLEDNEENDGEVDEHKALLKKKSEVSKQRDSVRKERDTRQKSSRDTLRALDTEATEIQAKLAAGLDPSTEAALRGRQVFVELRREELAASLPFVGVPTETLTTRVEDAEYQREELRAKLDQALAPGGKPTAHARRLKADRDALDVNRYALARELETRRMSERNATLAHAAAERHAARELNVEDAKAISEADEGRRGTKTEDLAETYADRLAERIPVVEARLLQEAEQNVVRAYGDPHGGVDVAWRVQDQRIREEMAQVEEWRKRYEQGQ